jgi:hypothetical protein
MDQEKTTAQVSPFKIFGALILLNLFLAAIVVIFPEGKISFGKDFSLNFVPLKKNLPTRHTKKGRCFKGNCKYSNS